MAEEVGIEYGRAMAAGDERRDRQRSFRTALHAVADALTAHGFAAHTEKRGNQLQIVNQHCPFGATAIEHPVICAVDRGMVQGDAGRALRRHRAATAESLPQGDVVCVTSSVARPDARRRRRRDPPLPRPRVHVAAPARGGGGDGGWFADPLAGDPARIHTEGHATGSPSRTPARRWRRCSGARSREVVFTSGATESIATAVWGARRAGRRPRGGARRRALGRAPGVGPVGGGGDGGGRATGVGRVAPDDVVAALRPDTALVHLQWGNHEVGTLQPVAEVVAACRAAGVLVHVDAAQAAGRVPVDFAGLGADLMSVSAHKMGGPPGIGALLIRRGLRLRPLLVGGDQERARRAGFENVPAILGWAGRRRFHRPANRRRFARVTRRPTDRGR